MTLDLQLINLTTQKEEAAAKTQQWTLVLCSCFNFEEKQLFDCSTHFIRLLLKKTDYLTYIESLSATIYSLIKRYSIEYRTELKCTLTVAV